WVWASGWGVEGQAARPPMWNMVLPLSRSGEYGPSASADTVSGMVMNQNAAAAITASSTATITSLRSIGTLLRFYSISSGISRSAVRHQSRGRPVARVAPTPAPDCDNHKRRLRRLLAVGLMTTTAILAHLGDLNLEAVEVLGCVPGRLGLGGKLGEPGGEIGLVLPNRRQRRGIA